MPKVHERTKKMDRRREMRRCEIKEEDFDEIEQGMTDEKAIEILGTLPNERMVSI